MIETEKYIRKPLYVDAVRITNDNFDAIADWCQGEVQQAEGRTKQHIKVRVHNPKNPRQTQAFVGDWLLYTERGYKVYTNKAFHASFDVVAELPYGSQTPGEEATTAPPIGYKVGDQIFAPEDVKIITDPVDEKPWCDSQDEGETATPEGIADAVAQNEQARALTEDEARQEVGYPSIDTEGKRVLSLEEQEQMDQDEIRELIQSGEVVLAQDLAA